MNALRSYAQDDEQVIAKAKATVSVKMKDPNSAQFKDVRHYKSGSVEVVCGSINAKNSYDGYVGFKQFVVLDAVTFVREEYNASQFDGVHGHFCRSKGAQPGVKA